jgi:hypothetical protein
MNDFVGTEIASRRDVKALDRAGFWRNQRTATNVHVGREPELLAQTLPRK